MSTGSCCPTPDRLLGTEGVHASVSPRSTECNRLSLMKSADAVTPRERQRARTTKEILDAALEQMARDGIAALNLTEVAARVGLAQPSLYRYFASKNAVYDALFA